MALGKIQMSTPVPPISPRGQMSRLSPTCVFEKRPEPSTPLPAVDPSYSIVPAESGSLTSKQRHRVSRNVFARPMFPPRAACPARFGRPPYVDPQFAGRPPTPSPHPDQARPQQVRHRMSTTRRVGASPSNVPECSGCHPRNACKRGLDATLSSFRKRCPGKLCAGRFCRTLSSNKAVPPSFFSGCFSFVDGPVTPFAPRPRAYSNRPNAASRVEARCVEEIFKLATTPGHHLVFRGPPQ